MIKRSLILSIAVVVGASIAQELSAQTIQMPQKLQVPQKAVLEAQISIEPKNQVQPGTEVKLAATIKNVGTALNAPASIQIRIDPSLIPLVLRMLSSRLRKNHSQVSSPVRPYRSPFRPHINCQISTASPRWGCIGHTKPSSYQEHWKRSLASIVS